MAANGTGAVFFLGTRAHYQVLEQPSNYDAENGNASTETIYQNRSVEELWPAGSKDVKYDGNYNQEKVNWYTEDCEVKVLEVRGDSCIKRRTNGRSTEALLCDDVRPAAAALNDVEEKTSELKAKPRRMSLLSYLTSLARRKRPSDKHYLQHMESVLNTCTYRESCRCLDCQVLEQPSNYDAENGNASTETIYQNRSVEELWPAGSKDVKYDGNYNQEKVNWYTEDCEVKVLEVRGDSCIKRRTNGRSTEALLCDDVRPAAAALNDVEEKTSELKAKPRRVSLLSYLTSLARRKRPSDKHYLQHMESVLNTCTYRESCRCLDCQVSR
ncbi:hypothetical protein KGM_212078 [Danaus plexippus plexippus]|uniref:DUF4802 domain-containing protein n=1 Tax=Danaus plexippus plexippus TaxID=278856 RepID=A0A212ET33_DANPL|nr:hypothetical protein KGM_212078 [Danaus plexippus plexippus]